MRPPGSGSGSARVDIPEAEYDEVLTARSRAADPLGVLDVPERHDIDGETGDGIADAVVPDPSELALDALRCRPAANGEAEVDIACRTNLERVTEGGVEDIAADGPHEEDAVWLHSS